MFATGVNMHTRVSGLCPRRFIAGLVWGVIVLPLCAAAANVERTGSLAIPGASDEIKKAVDQKGYRVVFDDGWTAEFWFARGLATTAKDAAGALYPQVANGQFVGAVNFPKGSSDFRGQAIPAGAYTLRYQSIPQDANHMGVSPNPDFLLAIPIAADDKPSGNLTFQRLVSLSAKTTGTAHPAVIALAPSGETGSVVKDDQGMTVLTVEVLTVTHKALNIGIVLKGQATQ
jgi:hypothetical protein